jgi:hypothetical protein
MLRIPESHGGSRPTFADEAYSRSRQACPTYLVLPTGRCAKVGRLSAIGIVQSLRWLAVGRASSSVAAQAEGAGAHVCRQGHGKLL